MYRQLAAELDASHILDPEGALDRHEQRLESDAVIHVVGAFSPKLLTAAQSVVDRPFSQRSLIPAQVCIQSFWLVWVGAGTIAHSRRMMEAMRSGAAANHSELHPQTQHMDHENARNSTPSQ